MNTGKKRMRFVDYMRGFCLSDGFIYLTAAIVFTGWLSGYWIYAVAVLFALMAAALAVCEDTTPVLAPLYMFTMTISVKRDLFAGEAWMLWFIALPFAAAVFHIIRYRYKLYKISLKGRKGFALSLVLLVIPMSLAGIFRGGQRNVFAVLAAPALTALIALFYLFFTITADKREGRIIAFVIKTVFITSILVSVQLITVYIGVALEGGGNALIDYIKYKNLSLGWAGSNNAAPVLAMTLPAGLYYSLKKSKLSFVYILIALVQFLLVVSTGSRGTILLLTMAMPFMLFYVMAKTPNKLQTGLAVSIFSAVTVIIAAYFAGGLISAFSEIAGRGLGDNGRLVLYGEALDTFTRYPVFGAGWDYRLGELYGDGITPYWYHSTALQILANMGIVGGLLFLYFYYWRYRTLLSAATPAKLALFAGVLIFDLYGMVDVNFFGPTFFIMMLLMTFAAESTLEESVARRLV